MLRPCLLICLLSCFCSGLQAQTPIRLIQDGDLQGSRAYHWQKDTIYLLDGLVYLEAGGSLRIEAGTVIKGKAQPSVGAYSALIISQGAAIEAMGSPLSPIIFTAEQDDTGDPADMAITSRGLWGGLVLLGRGRINTSGAALPLEGLPAADNRSLFGGSDDEDGSGVLSYVSIRHAGAMSNDTGLAGLTLAGVGSGTALNHLEVCSALGDGIRLWGGTAGLKYTSTAFCGADQVDWDYGWRGKGIYWFSVQAEDMAGYAINGRGGPDAGLFSDPQIYNLTLIGAGPDPAGANPAAIYLHDNSAGRVANSIFIDFPNYGIEVEDRPGGGDSWAQLEQGRVQILSNYWRDFGAGSRLDAGAEGIIRVSAGADHPEAGFLVSHLFENSNLAANPQIESISRMPNQELMPNRLNCYDDLFASFANYPQDPFFFAGVSSNAFRAGRGAFNQPPSFWWWINNWGALAEYGYLKACSALLPLHPFYGADTLFLDCRETESLWNESINEGQETAGWGCRAGCPWTMIVKLTASADRRSRRKRRNAGDQLRLNLPNADVSCYLEEWIWEVSLIDNETLLPIDTAAVSRYVVVIDTFPPEISLMPNDDPGGPPFTPGLTDCDTAWITQFYTDISVAGMDTIVTYTWQATDFCGNTSSLSVQNMLSFPLSTYYRDGDGDGYGDPAASLAFHNPLPGYVSDNTDCDDQNAAKHPGNTENPDNAIDDDCDGTGGIDHCQEAMPLLVGAPAVRIPFFGATPSPGQPLFECSQRGAIPDVWLTATVPSSGNLGIYVSQDLDFLSFTYIVSVYRGSCGNLEPLGCFDELRTEFKFTGLAPGELIWVRIGGKTGFPEDTWAMFYDFEIPANDNCSGAIPLPVRNDSCNYEEFIYFEATSSFNMPFSGCSLPGETVVKDVWFSAVAPSSGQIAFFIEGALSYELYRGSCDTLVPVKCNLDGAPSYLDSLTPGEVIWSRVSLNLQNAQQAYIQLCIADLSTFAPPPNDDCINAIELQADSCNNTAYSIRNAAPSPGSLPLFCGNQAVVEDVWFKVTVPASGNLLVEASGEYPIIQLYQGSSCDNLIAISCSDNSFYNQAGAKVFNREPGSAIYCRIISNESPLTVCARDIDFPPANDLCEDAVPLPLYDICRLERHHNFGATLTPDLAGTECAYEQTLNDTWFSVLVPPSGQFFVEAEASSFYPEIQVFRGVCSDLQLVGCSFGSLFIEGLLPGLPVRIRVNRKASPDMIGGSGDGEIRICAYDTTGSFFNAASISGLIRTEAGEPLEGAEVSLTGPAGPLSTTYSVFTGAYLFSGLNIGQPYQFAPRYNGPANQGLSNLDQIAILKHYLGIQLLDSPYKILAADVDFSQSIGFEDVSILQQIILGRRSAFPSGDSWRFVPEAYDFPDPANPWAENFPVHIEIDNLDFTAVGHNFVAIKLGDVNGTALGSRTENGATFTALEPQLLGYLRDNPGVPVLSAYPNPARQSLQVSYLVLEPGPVRLDVFSIDGRRLQQQLLSETLQETGAYEEQFSIGALPAGLYLLRLESPDGAFLNKIVKY